MYIMDFSKQLANLQRTVSRASAKQPGGEVESGTSNPNNGPSRRYHPYPNHFPRRRDGGHSRFSSDEEYYLPKLIKSIPKYHPVQMKKEKQRHIAFLFLIIDDLPLQHIWERFFETLSHTSGLIISVIVHAKYPEKVTNSWTRQRLLSYKPSHRDLIQTLERSKANSYVHNDALPPPRFFSRKPEWGSIDITRAMIDLLDEGLRIGTHRDDVPQVLQMNQEYIQKFSSRRYISNSIMPSFLKDPKTTIPTVDRFVFLSETCMPVCTMDELELSLFGPIAPGLSNEIPTTPQTCPYHSLDAEKSWIKAINKPNNGYARQLQWDAVFAIPQEKIWKADQWITLTRHHAWPILSLADDAVQSIQKEAESIRGDSGNNRNASRNRLQIAPWQCFRKVKASDEMYFPTMMALLGIINKGQSETTLDDKDGNNIETREATSVGSTDSNEVADRRVTYCDWSMNARNPETFIISTEDNFNELKRVVQLAREEGCLFARKIVLKGSVEESKLQGQSHGTNDNERSSASLITGDQWLEIISK
jgi:hypothetical protein